MELLANVDKEVDYFISNCQKDCSEKLKNVLKETYDKAALQDKNINNKKDVKKYKLPKLIVQNFDLEQIWQQLELNHNLLINKLLKSTSTLSSKATNLSFADLEKILPINNEENEGAEYNDVNKEIQNSDDETKNSDDEEKNSDAESSCDGDELNDDDEAIEDNREAVEDNEEEIDNEEDSNDDMQEDPEEKNQNNSKQTKKPKKSIVDDTFFKLDEMENFLKQEENPKEIKKRPSNPDEESDSEEDENNLDLFEASDDEENNENEIMYDDFFGEAENEAKHKNKRKRFNNSEESNESGVESDLDQQNVKKTKLFDDKNSDDESDDDDSTNGKSAKKLKSSLELRQERLKKTIERIEDEAVKEKPWQMQGEVTSHIRPENSLLEKVLEFDQVSRPAPVITEETNLKLEDIIKRRIKDKAFDSVERKAKPVETPIEYKKKLMLDQEKSKESLAQIYEREYLQQKEALDPNAQEKDEVESQQHKEIRLGMNALFVKLDALSNFHYTPRSAIPELKIVSNLPAISLEEVAPVTSTDASVLAPEEIRAKKLKGDEIGKSERTATDKKRERRKKKAKQKFHANLKKKKEGVQLQKAKNVKIAKVDNNAKKNPFVKIK